MERNVSDIYVHPEWNIFNEEYDADLANLALSEKIQFSNYIQQVLLPADEIVIDGKTIDVNGTIIGWGVGEGTHISRKNSKTGTYSIIK